MIKFAIKYDAPGMMNIQYNQYVINMDTVSVASCVSPPIMHVQSITQEYKELILVMFGSKQM